MIINPLIPILNFVNCFFAWYLRTFISCEHVKKYFYNIFVFCQSVYDLDFSLF